jgi:hypothetical protein
MFNYHIQADLASERRKALLTEAQTARRVRDARSRRLRAGSPAASQSPLFSRAGRLTSRGIIGRRAPRYAADSSHVA